MPRKPRRGRRSRRQFNRRKYFDRPLRASLSEISGWTPPQDVYPVNQQPQRLPSPLPATKKVLAALEALPKLAASIGLAVADHPAGNVELLPGEPATLAFTTGNVLKGLFYLPSSESEVRKAIGLPVAEIRDRYTDRLWEEDRHEG